ncbi:polysaccharide lyase family 8 super-sandwich domain-containing protein [Streptomyces sp. NPDC001594]|uniref:polysaccharide lyase family 8 super-sandwich domain-containing protein n=1 Tax=Streptomyces sp. NPDC001594 TaxID=3364590 RepID=UPI0036D16CB7
MDLSRRRMLNALSCAGVPPVLRGRAAGDQGGERVPDRDAACARLLANLTALFAGTAASNRRPETRPLLDALALAARADLAAMDRARGGEIFAGLPLGDSEARLEESFRRLYGIALATRVPGGAAPGASGGGAARPKVLRALVRLYEEHYGDRAPASHGNWFPWEIGIPRHAGRTLALLAPEAAARYPGLTAAYVAAMDRRLGHGAAGDVDLDSRFHTAANLADITTNRMVQGALLGDPARIRKAVADQLTVLDPLDPYAPRHGVTDGFHRDGSFVQHGSVASTGSYGTALLTRVVEALSLLDGTGLGPGPEAGAAVYGWIRDGFAPLVFEGWMTETVKGRALTRPQGGYADARAVCEAVLGLSALTTGDRARALRAYARHLGPACRAGADPAAFVSPLSFARYADLLADPAVRAADLAPPRASFAFNAMDRTVHRRPGYAFVLARSSTRTSKYEYLNGENLMPWFQGDGAHRLYLSGEDQGPGHDVGHYATVSPYGLPGVSTPVERRRTVPELYGGALYYDNPSHALAFTASSASQNAYVYFPRGTADWSGGTVLGAYGAAGMVQSDDEAFRDRALLPADFTVYRGATATKSWFLFDEEVLVLAADVADLAGRAVTTTVDARTAHPDDRILVTGATRDGRPYEGPGAGTAPCGLRWLRHANLTRGTAVGYLFLDPSPVRVGLDLVTGSPRAVRLANPAAPVTRRVFTAALDRPAGAPPLCAAWALVPDADEERMRGYGTRGGPLRVLANTARLQAVAHTGLGLLAANCFAPGPHGTAALRLDGPGSVIVAHRPADRDPAAVRVAVSDPTTRRAAVGLLLPGRWLRPVEGDPRVRVRHVAAGTRLEVDTRRAHGRSFTVTLRPTARTGPVHRTVTPPNWM